MVTLKPLLGQKVTVHLKNDLVNVIGISETNGNRDWSLDLVHQAYALEVFSNEESELWRKIVSRSDRKAPATLKGTPLEASYKRLLDKHVHVEITDYRLTEGGVVLGKRPMFELFLNTRRTALPESVLYGKIKGLVVKEKLPQSELH